MRAEQDGPDTVLVTWTPPPAPPAAGYQVQATVGTTTLTRTTDVTGTSHTISVYQFGVYSIRVRSLSQHLPSEATAPVQITVKGIVILWVYRQHKYWFEGREGAGLNIAVGSLKLAKHFSKWLALWVNPKHKLGTILCRLIN